MLDNRLDARFREWYPQFRQTPAPVTGDFVRDSSPVGGPMVAQEAV